MTQAFVIGHPIAHSRSPSIHRYWLDHYGIEGRYEAVDVAPADLGRFIEGVRDGRYAGGNVTIPHKQAVLTLCDRVDPLAARIGAVNTLVAENRALSGYNTDYTGFLSNLDQGAPGWDDPLARAIVVGAGGAARAIVVALLERTAAEIVILNRSDERARALAAEMGGAPGRIATGPLSAYGDLAPKTGLLVNTSSVGMGGSRFDGLDPGALAPGAVVNDIVYTPLLTPLLAEAQAAGMIAVDGLGMLLHQAAPGFAAWFGVDPEVTPALRRHILASVEGD